MRRCSAPAPIAILALLAGAITLLLVPDAFRSSIQATPLRPAPTGQAVAGPAPPPDPVIIPAGPCLKGSTPVELRAALAAFAREEGRAGALQRVLGSLVADEAPQRKLELSAFAIDRLEVSVAEYGRCVRAGRCTAVPAASVMGVFRQAAAPQVNVTWHQAAACCAFRGGRLPTEAEWEKAARGPLGRIWPWGDAYHERAFNHGTIHPLRDAFHGSAADGWFWIAPRGSFPTDRSLYGVLDLAGNAAEWVADWYQIGHWASANADQRNPTGPPGGLGRLIKGGSWRRLRLLSRPAARRFLEPDQRAADVGFRCARSVPR